MNACAAGDSSSLRSARRWRRGEECVACAHRSRAGRPGDDLDLPVAEEAEGLQANHVPRSKVDVLPLEPYLDDRPTLVSREMVDDADRQAEIAHRCALTNATRAGQHDDDPAVAPSDIAADHVHAPVKDPECDDDDRDEPDLHRSVATCADETAGEAPYGRRIRSGSDAFCT